MPFHFVICRPTPFFIVALLLCNVRCFCEQFCGHQVKIGMSRREKTSGYQNKWPLQMSVKRGTNFIIWPCGIYHWPVVFEKFWYSFLHITHHFSSRNLLSSQQSQALLYMTINILRKHVHCSLTEALKDWELPSWKPSRRAFYLSHISSACFLETNFAFSASHFI